MANSSSFPSKWSRPIRSAYGLPNKWYQSKSRRHLERRQHLDFIQRKLRRQKEADLGFCIKQISRDCKEMLKKKMEEILQYNNTLNQQQSTNIAQYKYKNYKHFQCKQNEHIVKFCPEDNKKEDMATKTDMSNFARERKEDFKPNKPSVMLKYPESIHFSTTCMIKGTDHANWDDICRFTGKASYEIKYKGNRCSLVYMFNNKESQKFDEDRMRTMYNQYLKEYFESLDASMDENLIQIKGYTDILEESTRKVEEKDKECLIPHQWDFGEAGAPIAKSAVLKGKVTLEHFGIKLQGILSRPSTSRMTGNKDSSSSNTSDDFNIIT
nr:ARID DNA-binding domain-containing protein [Tanacetum cinerariifolium]